MPAVKARNWDDYRLTAARRIVQANVADSFSGPLPQRLQSIPVLQVQLNRDGSVRRIEVLRTPKFAPQTVKLAMAAVHQSRAVWLRGPPAAALAVQRDLSLQR